MGHCTVGCAGQASFTDRLMVFTSGVSPGSHSGCGLEFQEKKLGSLKIESLRPGSGRVKVSGADFFLGRSFGTDRNSGASVERGVDGALLGPLRVLDGNGVSEMAMAGGKVPIFWLVASCVARSYSLTSSIVMSVGMVYHLNQHKETHNYITISCRSKNKARTSSSIVYLPGMEIIITHTQITLITIFSYTRHFKLQAAFLIKCFLLKKKPH